MEMIELDPALEDLYWKEEYFRELHVFLPWIYVEYGKAEDHYYIVTWR